MLYKVFFHPKAKKSLEKLEHQIRKRIKNKLHNLKESPEKKGEHLRYSYFWKIRAGEYRIIYEIDIEKQRVIVLFIGHRKNVYDDFSKLF